MPYMRDESLNKFTDDELLQMVKEELDKLGISYEEGPCTSEEDWRDLFILDPKVFDQL